MERSKPVLDFTNGRGSDLDGPIRHAKPDRRMHTTEEPHTLGVLQIGYSSTTTDGGATMTEAGSSTTTGGAVRYS